MKRHLHLYELPKCTQKKIFCTLDKGFRNRLFREAVKKYGTKVNLGKALGVSDALVYAWTNGSFIRGRKRDISISIYNLFEIAANSGIGLDEAEKSIRGLKARGVRSKLIANPQLPLKLNYELGRLIGISLGDAHLTKTGTIIYTNTERALLEEAVRCAKAIGSVSLVPNLKNCYVLIPAGIGLILNGLGIPLGSKSMSKIHIPGIVFDSPQEMKFGVVSGLFDDEGAVVADGKIVFEQNLENVVKDVAKLCHMVGIDTSKPVKFVRKTGRVRYSFNFRGGSHVRKYLLLTGLFKHPKKVKILESIKVVRVLRPRKGTRVSILLTNNLGKSYEKTRFHPDNEMI